MFSLGENRAVAEVWEDRKASQSCPWKVSKARLVPDVLFVLRGGRTNGEGTE